MTPLGSRLVKTVKDVSKPAKGITLLSKANASGPPRHHALMHHAEAAQGLMSPSQRRMRSQQPTFPQQLTGKSSAQIKRQKSLPKTNDRQVKAPVPVQAQAAQGLVRMRRQEHRAPGEVNRLNRSPLHRRLHTLNHAQRVDQTVSSE